MSDMSKEEAATPMDPSTAALPTARRQQVCLWLTPKIFRRLAEPAARVAEFFDHYAAWIDAVDELVLVVCAGNGDHVLNYRGSAGYDDAFDWARYNSYGGSQADPHAHNLDWLRRVREGGELSGNPFCAGPMFILSEEKLTYRLLADIYAALRAEAARRGITMRLLEYLEPGPEFCAATWKTERHPEAAPGAADAGGTMAPGVIDVCSVLSADPREYAAYPGGIASGTVTGDFVAAQAAAFVEGFGLDGIFLGNQFGLLGFWHPDNAPEPTADRRAGISRFFRALREQFGERLVYWMDSYWPAETEITAWAMDPENYLLLDAVMCCNFAVLVEPGRIVPNLVGKSRIRDEAAARGLAAPKILYSVDFVDPWYAYLSFLDHKLIYAFQREVYLEYGGRLDGVAFFANDTFGHFVPPGPLDSTLKQVRSGLARERGVDPRENSVCHDLGCTGG